MSESFTDIHMLLIQARDEQDILSQEKTCFIERCGLEDQQIETVNLTQQRLEPIDYTKYDAIMIGGSGVYSAAENYSWTPHVIDVIRESAARSFPLMGSCWGHQIIARALGGNVVYDKELTEMGCHWIYLNETGRQDELFNTFPVQFKANMGHHDRVNILPPDAVDLAFSDTQSHQAFRIKGKPIYGTQFHSELNAERERERLIAYREHYPEVETDELFQEIIDDLADTTEVDGLLKHFLELFVLKNHTVR